MNDAEYEAQKARLLALSDRWLGPLGLKWWDISLAYARDDFEVNGQPAPKTVACADVNWRYAHATITWNMPNVAEQTDDALEWQFVHECMHVFLNEARENGDDWLDHEERVASTLTKAFLWLRDSMAMDIEPERSPDGVVTETEYTPDAQPPTNTHRPDAIGFRDYTL